MSIQAAFQNQGNTFSVTTNASASTASAQLASFNPVLANQPAAQASGLTNCPSQVRVVNLGNTTVWISFTTALRVAVIPAGTPQLETPVLAGEDIVFTLQQLPNAGSATPYTIQINTISTGVSQALAVSFGEGM